MVLNSGLETIQKIRLAVGDGLGAYIDRDVNEELIARCPTCHRGMDREPLGENGAVQIDVCIVCKGTWLDAGELISAFEQLRMLETIAPTLILKEIPEEAR